MRKNKKLAWLIALVTVLTLTFMVSVGLAEEPDPENTDTPAAAPQLTLELTGAENLTYQGNALGIVANVRLDDTDVTGDATITVEKDNVKTTISVAQITDAGTYKVSANYSYTPEGETEQTTLSATPVSFTVKKADVEASLSNNELEYNPAGYTLPTVSVSSTAAVSDADYTVTDPTVNTVGSYTTLIKLNNSNLKWKDTSDDTLGLTFQVVQKEIEPQWPDEKEITYGTKLSDLTLEPDDYGTFTWADGNTVPEANTAAVGYPVNYKLADETNYKVNATTGVVKVKVNPVKVSLIAESVEGITVPYKGAAYIADDLKPFTKIEFENESESVSLDYSVAILNAKDVGTYQLTGSLSNTNFTFGTDDKVQVEITPAKVTKVEYQDTADSIAIFKNVNIELPAQYLFTTEPAGLGSEVKFEVSTDDTVHDAKGYTLTFTINDGNFEADNLNTLTFTVQPAEISKINFASGKESPYTFTGEELTALDIIESVVANEVTYSQDNCDLVKLFVLTINGDEDFTAHDVGKYNVKAAARSSNFTGYNRDTNNFEIVPAEIKVSQELTKKTYDAELVEAADIVKVESDAKTFDEDDYIVSFTSKNNNSEIKDVDEYTITVTASGDDEKNYNVTGSPVTYTITVDDLGEASWTIDDTRIYDAKDTTKDDICKGIIVKPANSENETEALVLNTDYTISAPDAPFKNAGKYEVTIEGKAPNFTGTKTLTYTIEADEIGEVAWSNEFEETRTYDRKVTTLDEIKQGIIVAPTNTENDSKSLTLDTDYTITAEKDSFVDAGEYVITIEGKSPNFEGKKTLTYTINPAKITSFTLTPASRGYNPSVTTTAADLVGEVKAEGDLTLEYGEEKEYLYLIDDEEAKDGIVDYKQDGYTIKLDLKSGNFEQEKEVIAIYMVEQAKLNGLMFGEENKNNFLFYHLGRTYSPDEDLKTNEEYKKLINPRVTATDGKVTFDVEDLKLVTFTESEGKAISDTGKYKIQAAANKSNDPQNYTTDIVEADFEIKPATIMTLKFAQAYLTYNHESRDPDAEIKLDEAVNPTVTVYSNNEDDTFDLIGEEALEVVTFIGDREIKNVGEYTITVKANENNDPQNYNDVTATATFEIKRLEVDPITITFENDVIDSEKNHRRGGPAGSEYRTFSVKGSSNELIDIKINNAEVQVTGEANFTIDGNDVILNGQTVITLEDGQTYTIEAMYDDETNLAVKEETENKNAEDAHVTVQFIYDITCELPTVRQLMNRAENAISFTAPEDYKSVAFASDPTSENGTAINISAVDLEKGDCSVALTGNNKFFSTQHHASNLYSGKYVDRLGNEAEVTDYTIGRSSGTLVINGVTPEPNENGWIGQTPTLTWNITMTSTGGLDELTHFSIGAFGTSPTLHQDSNDVTINASSLQTDAKLFIIITFDDLNNSASGTFQSIGYDAQADEPVLTTALYDGCNVLAGIAEPSVRLTISVNGETISVNSDRWGGFFTDELPLAYEGDVVTISYYDKAGNFKRITRIVGEEDDAITLDAYMMGKVRTNAHTVGQNESPRWTTILNATEEELKAGLVKLPIVAGNVVEVGEITISMDANNVISYTYTLNDDIEQVGDEVVVIDPNRDAEALMFLNGQKIDRNGTAVQVKGKNPTYSIVAKFVVKVPAENLEETFQTDSSSELKAIYVQRQTQRQLMASIK